MSPAGFDAIFLDFDGVVLESVEIKGWAFGKLFEHRAEHVEEIVKFHHENSGMSRFDKFRHIYRNILKEPLSDEELERLCDDFAQLIYNRVMECDFVPGAREFLEKHHRMLPLFVISGTPREEVREIVAGRGLSNYFEGVYGSPTGKGVWVKKLLEEHGFKPKRVLFVGDALSDYKAAKDNGLVFAARVKDPGPDIFKGLDIDYRVKDLKELDIFISKNIGGVRQGL